jgi:hypothetical protein
MTGGKLHLLDALRRNVPAHNAASTQRVFPREVERAKLQVMEEF